VNTSDTEAFFILENQSGIAFKILGSRSPVAGIDVHRAEYSMSCRKGNDSQEEPEGFADPPAFSGIEAGERVRLTIHTRLTQQFKGGRCQLRLSLIDGPARGVKSKEFAP
jgi:hypothetical protein